MKTSNIILISFLVFLFGGITLLYIGSKYYNGINHKADFAIQEKKTAPFSVLVAEPGAYLVMKNGKEFSISQSYKKDRTPNFAPFEVRNDTLFVSTVKSRKDGEWFIVPEVYCKNVKSIIAKEQTNVSLKNYQADSLFVNLNKSNLSGDLNKTVFVSFTSKDSYVRFKGENIQKLKLQLDKTELNIDSKKSIDTILGSLKNKSMLNCSIDGKLSLQIDKSSRLFFLN